MRDIVHNISGELWISALDVARRYGKCRATIKRWYETEWLGFPRPKLILRKLYFNAGEIAAWERQFSDRFGARGEFAKDMEEWERQFLDRFVVRDDMTLDRRKERRGERLA